MRGPKRKVSAASLANLKPVKKGDPPRNPDGKNGQELRSLFRAYFMGKDVDLEDPRAKSALDIKAPDHLDALKKATRTEKFWNVCRAAYRSALSGDKGSQRYIIDQMIGAIPQSVEMTGPGGAPVGGGAIVMLRMPDNGKGPKDEDPDDVGDGPPTDDGSSPDDN